jgi:hypothetical protein
LTGGGGGAQSVVKLDESTVATGASCWPCPRSGDTAQQRDEPKPLRRRVETTGVRPDELRTAVVKRVVPPPEQVVISLHSCFVGDDNR